MKKIIFALLLMFVSSFGAVAISSSSSVRAVDVSEVICGEDATSNPDICADFNATKDKDTGTNPLYGPEGIITRAVNGLSLAAGVIAIFIIIIAGIKMTLSTGDSGKIKSARDQIIYASIGLIVAVLAQGIVRFVLNRIGV